MPERLPRKLGAVLSVNAVEKDDSWEQWVRRAWAWLESSWGRLVHPKAS
jgi:hypothetical protein